MEPAGGSCTAPLGLLWTVAVPCVHTPGERVPGKADVSRAWRSIPEEVSKDRRCNCVRGVGYVVLLFPHRPMRWVLQRCFRSHFCFYPHSYSCSHSFSFSFSFSFSPFLLISPFFPYSHVPSLVPSPLHLPLPWVMSVPSLACFLCVFVFILSFALPFPGLTFSRPFLSFISFPSLSFPSVSPFPSLLQFLYLDEETIALACPLPSPPPFISPSPPLSTPSPPCPPPPPPSSSSLLLLVLVSLTWSKEQWSCARTWQLVSRKH